MEIIDNNTGNWLVQHDNGSMETIAKSKQNQLLIENNLWGLLRDGTEVFYEPATDDHPSVTLIPGDDAREFTLRVGEYQPIHVGPHEKTKLVDALFEGRKDETNSTVSDELVRLFDGLREGRVRSRVMDALASQPPFSVKVTRTSDGWVFHDHLLLTWNGEFYHPTTTSRNRSGGIVESGSSQEAYDVNVPNFSESVQDREVTLQGEHYRLTNAEMEFVAKALWAMTNAPQEVA